MATKQTSQLQRNELSVVIRETQPSYHFVNQQFDSENQGSGDEFHALTVNCLPRR